MEIIEVRPVTINDITGLQKIGRQTFFETFASGNTDENISRYLDENFSEGKVREELSNSDSQFYFAILDNKPIGYLKVNTGKSQTELKDERAVEIERIYVLRDFHGLKVGQLLYEKAMEIAGKNNAEYVWLGVWEANPRAIRFYNKNGFVEFDKHVFRLGEDEQTDIMMKKVLQP